MCILIADDDPVVRDVVRRYLERDGLTVRETADGTATLAALDDTDGRDAVENREQGCRFEVRLPLNGH